MNLDTNEASLPVYEALASGVRLQIIRLLAEKPRNVKELAQALGLSSAIMSMHVKKLERAGLIQTEVSRFNGGIQKICTFVFQSIHINLPELHDEDRRFHETMVPVGQYTDFLIQPTCGLSTLDRVIGHFDDPRYFLEPERVNARILWLTEGYLEYKVPNYLLSSQQPEELEISMELGSEAPGINEHWPSDISFFVNGIHVGVWTSPGDFGGRKGRFTPKWWSLNVGQYGLLKMLRITKEGTFMDGSRISEVTLEELNIRQSQWTFRVAVPDDAEHIGGLTLFGAGFGNYDQDILFRLYYTSMS